MALLRHPRLAHALMALRPGSRPLRDFVCEDKSDGLGPYLVEGSMINPPTQAEIDAVTVQQLDDALFDKSFKFDLVVARALFNHENRLRAFEGQQSITIQQFLAAIKAAER